MPSWCHLGIYTLVSTAFAWVAFVWFERTRKGFADVL
jgi:lipopolysaccharide transport system permease protein